MPKYVRIQEHERYQGWYTPGGYAMYPDDIEFNKEGPPVVPTYHLSNLYEGCGLPAPPLLETANYPETFNENALFESTFDKQEKNLPVYGRKVWVKPVKKNDLYTGYDQEGLPIFPDGSTRPLSMVEYQYLMMTRPQVSNNMPKKPNKSSSYKNKKNKNPAPRRVNLDEMFQQETDRIKKMKEYE